MSIKLKIIHYYSILYFLIFYPLCGFSFQVTDPVLINSNIRSGQLPNGFSYYIKPTLNGSTEIDMRLLMSVGYQHENSNQFQFAHLLEHIAANQGRQKYLKLLYEKGIPYTNMVARVGLDHTVYGIVIPGRQEQHNRIGLTLLKDKLDLEITLNKINKESRTILNEANGGLKSKHKILNDLESELTGLTVSPPQDVVHHLSTVKLDSLQSFYEEWYRPDLMALVIVGKIPNVDSLEDDIIKHFNNIPLPKESKIRRNNPFKYLTRKPTLLRKEFSLNDKNGNRINNTLIRFYKRQKINGTRTYSQNLEDDLIRKLIISMLAKRYKEKQEDYKVNYEIIPKFLVPPLAFILNISVNGNMEKEAIQNAIKTLKEVEYFGFSCQEFNESKKVFLSQIRNIDTTSSSYWMDEIIGHYLHKEPIVPNKNELMEDLLKNMSVHEFNILLKTFLNGLPDDINLVADSGNAILSVPENKIRGWISEVDSLLIKPYISPQVPNFLIDTVTGSSLKKIGYKKKESSIPGAKEYVLQNNLKIILKSFPQVSKSSSEHNLLYFQGIVKKGLTCFSKEDYFSALNAPLIFINSGVGGLDKFYLTRYLRRQGFDGRVSPYIDEYDSGIKGTVKFKELETALQLVYLYFTSPNINKLAFEDWKEQTKINSQYKDINREDFVSFINKYFSHSNLPIGSKALEGIEETDFKRAFEIYSQVFKDSGDFTFIFAGDFPEEEILDLCRKYLGNLPSSHENSIECNPHPVSRFLSPKNFVKSIPPPQPMKLSKIRLSYVTPVEESVLNWKEQIKTEILRRSMSTLLMEHLRFNAGLIYQTAGGLTYERPNPLVEFFIEYECLPENIEESILVSKKMIDFLITEPISEELFIEVITSSLSSFGEVSSYRSSLKEMYETYMFGEPWVSNSEKRIFINSLTRDDLLETAQRYLGTETFEFQMLPK